MILIYGKKKNPPPTHRLGNPAGEAAALEGTLPLYMQVPRWFTFSDPVLLHLRLVL